MAERGKLSDIRNEDKRKQIKVRLLLTNPDIKKAPKENDQKDSKAK